MYFAWKKQILWNFNDKMFFWYVSSSTIFAVVTNHFRTSYISNIGKCSLVYLDQHKICAGNSDDGEIWKRCGQKCLLLMKRPAAMWCQRAWRAEVKKGSAFALLFVQRTTGTFFFIHSHVRTYVYALPTNKHKRFKIDGLKPFFKSVFRNYTYTWLHMATHGYTCVNPVLVLFYTCSFVFFQFYTRVTPFFLGFTHGYTWLHMATHV